jgi:hypothetical protein
VLSGIVDLPWGFKIAPIMQVASARPYNPIQGLDVFGWGSGRGNAHVILLKNNPNDLLATKSMSAGQLRSCLGSGDCYQAPYNSLRGQSFFQLDARATKSVHFGERSRLDLIFQAFDLTNRANFGNNFDPNIRDANFRQPTSFITPSGVIVPRSFSGEIGARFVF